LQLFNPFSFFSSGLLQAAAAAAAVAAEQEVLEPAAALPALVPVAGMNSLVAVVQMAPTSAGMVDTAVGIACEAEACNRLHMAVAGGSMAGTDHSKVPAAA